MAAVRRCQACGIRPEWRIERPIDAAVRWACDEHLYRVCRDLQRPGELTRLTLTDHRQRRAG